MRDVARKAGKPLIEVFLKATGGSQQFGPSTLSGSPLSWPHSALNFP